MYIKKVICISRKCAIIFHVILDKHVVQCKPFQFMTFKKIINVVDRLLQKPTLRERDNSDANV